MATMNARLAQEVFDSFDRLAEYSTDVAKVQKRFKNVSWTKRSMDQYLDALENAFEIMDVGESVYSFIHSARIALEAGESIMDWLPDLASSALELGVSLSEILSDMNP